MRRGLETGRPSHGHCSEAARRAAEGILVDVAELWELFVLHCARRAIPAGFRIEHGTTVGRRDYLLRSNETNAGMGRVKPDVLVLRGDRTTAVIDAKYKRLTPSRERPNGVDQADLYQLAAYASRYQPEQVAALVYPHDRKCEPARAETQGPWRNADAIFMFRHLATESSACRNELASLLGVGPAKSLPGHMPFTT